MDNENYPVIPLPNPGEGGPVYPGDSEDSGAEPVIPLPNPGEGGPVYPGDMTPTPTLPSAPQAPIPPAIQPLPPSGVISPYPQRTSIRFLNAVYGYAPFRVYIGSAQAISILSAGAVSPYLRYPSGYRTVTVSDLSGYIYLQKSMPFEPGATSTFAIVNRAGGLDLTRITDLCCAPGGGSANFRVSNLAYNTEPMDVLLADGRVIDTDVQFKETTAYKRIAPGAYEFIFSPTNLLPMPASADIETLDTAFIGAAPLYGASASLYLRIRPGGNYTVFLMPAGTATNAISARVIEDR